MITFLFFHKWMFYFAHFVPTDTSTDKKATDHGCDVTNAFWLFKRDDTIQVPLRLPFSILEIQRGEKIVLAKPFHGVFNIPNILCFCKNKIFYSFCDSKNSWGNMQVCINIIWLSVLWSWKWFNIYHPVTVEVAAPISSRHCYSLYDINHVITAIFLVTSSQRFGGFYLSFIIQHWKGYIDLDFLWGMAFCSLRKEYNNTSYHFWQ